MKRGLPKEMQAGGGLDWSRGWGVARTVAVVLFCCFVIWNSHNIFPWIYSCLNVEYTPDSVGTIRVRKFWAGAMAVLMVFAGVGQIIWLYWYRKEAIKSAKGQWYDNAGLTKRDLYSDEEK